MRVEVRLHSASIPGYPNLQFIDGICRDCETEFPARLLPEMFGEIPDLRVMRHVVICGSCMDKYPHDEWPNTPYEKTMELYREYSWNS